MKAKNCINICLSWILLKISNCLALMKCNVLCIYTNSILFSQNRTQTNTKEHCGLLHWLCSEKQSLGRNEAWEDSLGDKPEKDKGQGTEDRWDGTQVMVEVRCPWKERGKEEGLGGKMLKLNIALKQVLVSLMGCARVKTCPHWARIASSPLCSFIGWQQLGGMAWLWPRCRDRYWGAAAGDYLVPPSSFFLEGWAELSRVMLPQSRRTLSFQLIIKFQSWHLKYSCIQMLPLAIGDYYKHTEVM